MRREQGAGPSCAVYFYGCTQRNSGACLGECTHSKQLTMRALEEEEEPRSLAEDPRREGSGPLCAVPVHRVGKYNMFFLFYLKKISFTISNFQN